jgi:hypothetical protein
MHAIVATDPNGTVTVLGPFWTEHQARVCDLILADYGPDGDRTVFALGTPETILPTAVETLVVPDPDTPTGEQCIDYWRTMLAKNPNLSLAWGADRGQAIVDYVDRLLATIAANEAHVEELRGIIGFNREQADKAEKRAAKDRRELREAYQAEIAALRSQ